MFSTGASFSTRFVFISTEGVLFSLPKHWWMFSKRFPLGRLDVWECCLGYTWERQEASPTVQDWSVTRIGYIRNSLQGNRIVQELSVTGKDLNSIENLWRILKHRTNTRAKGRPHSVDELMRWKHFCRLSGRRWVLVCGREWLRACLKGYIVAEGGYTHY